MNLVALSFLREEASPDAVISYLHPPAKLHWIPDEEDEISKLFEKVKLEVSAL